MSGPYREPSRKVDEMRAITREASGLEKLFAKAKDKALDAIRTEAELGLSMAWISTDGCAGGLTAQKIYSRLIGYLISEGFTVKQYAKSCHAEVFWKAIG